ncbi:MAG: DUF5107 domain-containing protein [Anaerolineae bacterium]|nr:DUF5107 domain-containing protein [Anaerolineae bacterium]
MTEKNFKGTVKAWEEMITFPTYTPPPADKNPMFLDKRVNQGTSGRVYPHPFRDALSSTSQPEEYQVIYLENEYLRLMMLPRFGGRIHEGYDKTNGYHFIYRQHVIKPALIGLFGAWISGGIEFNWPQHHRPSTFMPVHHIIEKGEDGSITVWMSEHDPLQRMKGMVGICLFPGKAFFEMKVQLYNRTPETQTFLWWVNVGVHVHDQYQVVFPEDVTVVTDHSKRSMSYFPIAEDTYYGIDYSDGVDLSWYKNIPVPTSYFVWDTAYDYFGGYDHRADAGILHVANRHIAPGKKMFTWGAGEFAKGWESNLTDADGPYIELMAGVYTDNQPDFSWMQPYETKIFSQYWYPVQRIGPAKNANKRAAVNLEFKENHAILGVAVTEPTHNATITLEKQKDIIYECTVDIVPGEPFVADVTLPAHIVKWDVVLRFCDKNGHELIRYQPQEIEKSDLPESKTPPPPPETFETVEELYLTGLHLEQYRHPTIEPEPYWEAGLAIDPTDTRCNNAMGLVYYRRGKFDMAIEHFNTAIEKLTRRNPNPRDGEVYFNLGMALKYGGELDAAYSAFFKAIWSYAWQAAGYYALAEIDCLRSDFVTALEHIDRSLMTNALNTKARNLKAAVLRKLGRFDDAASCACETIGLDPLDMWSRNELILQNRDQNKDQVAQSQLDELVDMMHVPDTFSETQAHFDLAFDYAHAGFWSEASDILTRQLNDGNASVNPMVLYALGYFAYLMDQHDQALEYYMLGSTMPGDYAFPARLEEMIILEFGKQQLPQDSKIAYHLANLYYDKKRYPEAITGWETAVAQDPSFSIAWRNLGIAAYNDQNDADKALAYYIKAFDACPEDGRVLSELDQLYHRIGASAETRLSWLEQHLDLVRARDDLSVALATLYNQTEQPQKALDYMLSRRFHPWEGGTGSISAQYVAAHVQLGKTDLVKNNAEGALKHFDIALGTYPENLGERKHVLRSDTHVHYYRGLALQALGNTAGAEESFRQALENKGKRGSTYDQALALRALGREQEARNLLEEMLDNAKQQLARQTKQGFATSIPQFVFAETDMQTRRRSHLNFSIGQAYLGLDMKDEAKSAFQQVLEDDPGNYEARVKLKQLKGAG